MLNYDSSRSNAPAISLASVNAQSAIDLHTIRFAPTDVLGAESIHEVRSLLGHLSKMQGRVRLLLDMSQVTLISSGALGMIVTLNNALRLQGGELLVVNVSEETAAILEITKLHRVLRVFPTTEEALATLDHAA